MVVVSGGHVGNSRVSRRRWLRTIRVFEAGTISGTRTVPSDTSHTVAAVLVFVVVLLLQLLGLAALVTAGFLVSLPLGLGVLGAALVYVGREVDAAFRP